MGMFEVSMAIANPSDKERRAAVKLLVDTGAGYSMIPRRVLDQIGVAPDRQAVFEIADGREITRDMGEVTFFWDGKAGISRVIFGEEGDSAVLGAVALQELGLQVDPVHHQLRPAKLKARLTFY